MPTVRQVQRTPRPDSLFAIRAQQLLANGESLQALELCRQGLIYYPDNPTGYAMLAYSYLALGDGDRARNVLIDGFRRTGARPLRNLHRQLQQPSPVRPVQDDLAVGVPDGFDLAEELGQIKGGSFAEKPDSGSGLDLPAGLDLTGVLDSLMKSTPPIDELVGVEERVEDVEMQEVEAEEIAIEDVGIEEVEVEDIEIEDVEVEEVESVIVEAEENAVEDVEIVEVEEIEIEDVEAEEVALEENVIEDVEVEEVEIEEVALEENVIEDVEVEEVEAEEIAIEDVEIVAVAAEEVAVEEIAIEDVEIVAVAADEHAVEEIKIAPPLATDVEVDDRDDLKKIPSIKVPNRDTLGSLALHVGGQSFRTRSSNLRLIPGLEFAPLRQEETVGRQSIAPLMSEAMPEPMLPPRTHESEKTEDPQTVPMPLLDGLELTETGNFPDAEKASDIPSISDSLIPMSKEPLSLSDALGRLSEAGLTIPFSGEIDDDSRVVVEEQKLTPLEKLARQLENARIPAVEEVSEQHGVFEPSIVSDTFANILVAQKAYAEAMKAFQILARHKPERMDYYQGRIQEMKDHLQRADND